MLLLLAATWATFIGRRVVKESWPCQKVLHKSNILFFFFFLPFSKKDSLVSYAKDLFRFFLNISSDEQRHITPTMTIILTCNLCSNSFKSSPNVSIDILFAFSTEGISSLNDTASGILVFTALATTWRNVDLLSDVFVVSSYGVE